MDVPAVGIGRLASDQAFEARNEFAAMVEEGMGDGSGVKGEEYAVADYVTGAEVSRRISLVTGLVEHAVLVNDFQDVVTASGVIPNMVIVDWEVARVPGVAVPNRKDDRSGEERAEENVYDTVARADQRVHSDGSLIPVKGGEGVKADAADTAGNRGQNDVGRFDPSDPVEVGHGPDDVVREPEVDEHCAEAVHEPPQPRDGPAVCGLVALRVESTLQRR